MERAVSGLRAEGLTTTTPAEAVIAEREGQVLAAMKTMFDAGDWDESSPWLLRFAATYMKQFPDQKAAMTDALNDLSHGVFVDGDAARLWKEHYLAALLLDQQKMNMAAITAARKKWREQVMENPQVLWGRLGPEIGCTVPGPKVRLAAFPEEAPLRFDINTAPAGILRMIPGITEGEVASWLEQRGKKAFASVEDFKGRAGLKAGAAAGLKF